jgi:hypothetical protein
MKTFSVYELSNGQPSRFYNSSTNSFTSDVKKATLYTKEEAESKKKELEKSRTDQYQKTGKNYPELHTGDLFKKGILKENKTIKITKTQLREIIKEEVQSLLNEGKHSSKKMTLKQIQKEMDELDKQMEKIGRGGIEYDNAMDDWDELNDMKKKLEKEEISKINEKEELTLLNESREFFNSFKKDFDNIVRYADAYLKGNVITVYLDTDPQNEARKINKLVQTKYKNSLRKMNSEADVMLFKIISDEVVEVKHITEKSKFPDLTGDGKVTRADILKGRGVKFNDDIKENLINNPNAVLKGKTIQSFKSNGYRKGYTITFEDGTTVNIRGGGAGAENTVYITKG